MSDAQRSMRIGTIFVLTPLALVLSGCGQVIDKLSTPLDAQSKTSGEITGPSNSTVSPGEARLDPSVVSSRPNSSSALTTYATQEEVVQKEIASSPTLSLRNQQPHPVNNDPIGFHHDPEAKTVRIGNFLFDMTEDFPDVRRLDQPRE